MLAHSKRDKSRRNRPDRGGVGVIMLSTTLAISATDVPDNCNNFITYNEQSLFNLTLSQFVPIKNRIINMPVCWDQRFVAFNTNWTGINTHGRIFY